MTRIRVTMATASHPLVMYFFLFPYYFFRAFFDSTLKVA